MATCLLGLGKRAVVEDIVHIRPKSQSETVHFELGLMYDTKYRWYLKEKSAEHFGSVANCQGMLLQFDGSIERESIEDNKWEREPILKPKRQRTKVRAKEGTVLRRSQRKTTSDQQGSS